MKHLVLVAVLGFAGAACSCREHGGSESASFDRTQVSGTVLDRSTGAPIAGAKVRFADGDEVSTDERGRFRLTDLPVGRAGDVVVRAGEGREGRITLRPLGRLELEVVVYAGR